MYRIVRNSTACLTLALGLAASTGALAQADTSRPVTYSTEQAENGQTRYERDCAECHGDDLRGGLIGGPPLRGLAFREKYASGQPASLMFGFMSAAMPPNSPGRYSPEVYANLMAYILQENDFEAGEPLPSDFESLNTLIVGEREDPQ